MEVFNSESKRTLCSQKEELESERSTKRMEDIKISETRVLQKFSFKFVQCGF